MKDFVWNNKHYYVSTHDIRSNTYNCLREGGDTLEFPEVSNAKSILIDFIENQISTDDQGNPLKPIVRIVRGVKISPTTHELLRVVLKM